MEFLKKNIANIMSFANLGFGILALHFAIRGEYVVACVMVLLSVLLDGFDGRVARHFDCCSELGFQLDSLCDLVGFGVAPAFLLYYFISPLLGSWAVVVSLIFALCGAYRLARFNVLKIHDHYVGMPITLAGLIVAFLGFFHAHIAAVIWLILALLLSFLMVCTLKIKKI